MGSGVAMLAVHSLTCLVLLTGLCVPLTAAPVARPSQDLIAGRPAGPWRRLFLDAMVVEQQEGLQRVFQVRLTANASNDSFGDVYFRKAK